MDESRRESLTKQKARMDRFVVQRDLLPEICRRMSWNDRYEKQDCEIWSKKFQEKQRFINFLDEAFDLTPMIVHQPKLKQPRPNEDWSWPCAPRKKKYLTTADNVLDLPSYSYNAFPELLDWSNDDILVASLGKRYYKWSWRTQTLVDEGVTMFDIKCCKFDPEGKLLLLGTEMRVEIHNELNKCQFIQYCKCKLAICTITAIDWSPTGKSFATGCSRGTICAMNQKDYPMKYLSLTDSAALVVRVSPNARYVAVAGVHTRKVWVLSWPDLQHFSILRTYDTVKDLHWHPWKTALLGIATFSADRHSSIIIWEPHVNRIRREEIGRGHYSIDTMRFNHRTGELLLSLWNLDVIPSQAYLQCSMLVVMSDFETVADHWGEGRSGLDRVRTMVFSPDGTKLATATAGEDLIIWNFLPDNYKKKINHKKFTAIPQFLDLCSNGFTIR